jgi:hypothetical protein
VYSRKIGNVNEGIVEGGEDAGNTENELACSSLVLFPTPNFRNFQHTVTGEGAEGDVLLSGGGSLLAGGHCDGWWLVDGIRNKEKKIKIRSHLEREKVDVCPSVSPAL